MGIDAEILIRGVRKEAATDEAIKLWSWDISRSIGANKFFIAAEKGHGAICKTLSRYRNDDDPAPGTAYTQDGDRIDALPNECLLEVNVWTRYYGVGYERGDLITLCAIAEWIEMNIPNAEVWYGGDSSGVCAEPWPESARRALRKHLYSSAGRNYFNYGKNELTPPPCLLCVPERSPAQCGWGKDYVKVHCAGCGISFATRDHGTTWTVDKEE